MRESLTVDIGRFASRMAVVLELEKEYGKLTDDSFIGNRDKTAVELFKSILEKSSYVNKNGVFIEKRRTVGDAKKILLALGFGEKQVAKALRSFIGDKVWSFGSDVVNFIG